MFSDKKTTADSLPSATKMSPTAPDYSTHQLCWLAFGLEEVWTFGGEEDYSHWVVGLNEQIVLSETEDGNQTGPENGIQEYIKTSGNCNSKYIFNCNFIRNCNSKCSVQDASSLMKQSFELVLKQWQFYIGARGG